MANEQNLKPFVKGDKRINRNGRPKSFDAWRKMTIELLREPALDKNGQPIIITDGNGHEHIATNAEMIARSWIQSPKRQRDVIEAAFGKVPDKLEITQIDVDREIERELARVAARRQTKDAGDTESENSSGENSTT